ncbi:MAG: hypothetical protein KF801_05470 [Cryobacterium sp.]|nr:hypothetical protein [Cryobacterium sp.]
MGYRGGRLFRRAIARFVGVLAVVALLSSMLVVSTSTPAMASGEGTILSLINRDRAAKGLGPLKLNSAINAVALNWAKSMAAKDSMVHNPNYSTQIPSGWTRAGENIAHGYSSPGAVHAAWMNSPGHRANILGDYTDVGIAFITVDGSTWAVEDFAKYGKTSTPKPVTKPKPATSTKKPSATAKPTSQAHSPAPAKVATPPKSAAPVSRPAPDLSFLPASERTPVTSNSSGAPSSGASAQPSDSSPTGVVRSDAIVGVAPKRSVASLAAVLAMLGMAIAGLGAGLRRRKV